MDLAARARVALPVVVDAHLTAATRSAQDVAEEAVGEGRPVGRARPRGRRSGSRARPGWPWDPVGPGGPSAATSSDLARAIEERVIAVLRKRPADAYGLSPREQEVLDILAEGRTDRDIAARLFISERTVHVHVRRILAKLGVSSRTEAAGVAIRQGLVPAEMPERAAAPSASSRERMT